MKKRVLSIFLAVILAFTMLGTVIYAADNPMSLDVTAKNGLEYERGDTVILTVSMKDYEAANLLAIAGEYDSAILTGVKASKGELGAPVFNAKTLYSSWAQADNFVVEDEDFNPVSEFALVSYRFTVAADAAFGETTVKVYFAQEDANGSKNTNAYYDGKSNVVMTPGEDYVAEATEITLNIVCNHEYAEGYTQPAAGTAMESAQHTQYCTKCQQNIPADCEFAAEVTDPTHTENGYTTHTCICGYTVVDTETAALGHEFGDYEHDEVLTDGKHTHTATCIANDGGFDTQFCEFTTSYTDPTCTEDGYVTYTCTDCGYYYDVIDEGSAKGHKMTIYNYVESENGINNHTVTCSVKGCGYTETEACTMGEWAIIDEPTKTETGLKKRTCIHCETGYETEVLPKLAYLTVVDSKGIVGREMTVDVVLTNNPGVSGMVFEVEYNDAYMTLAGVEQGDLGGEDVILQGPIDNNGVHKIALATTGTVTGDGVVIRLIFNIADELVEGDYAVKVSANDVCDGTEELKAVAVEGDEGVATLIDYMLGDVNRDKKITVADAVLLLRYAAGMDVTVDLLAADLVTAEGETEGEITVADGQYLLQVLIGAATLED
ncbi:MAG: hypothetical protein IJ043_01735 [Clostridia bacterium]|nr:hypothetical protein [Clostridia bacterium]